MKLLSVVLIFALPALSQNTDENLKPPVGERLILETHAKGDQVYACQASAAGFAWVLSGPDAKLFNDSGKQAAIHFAGPTWQGSDGSRVKGKVVQTWSPDSESIPWLTLQAVDHSGEGIMKAVTTIQRLHTHGGKAPPGGCDADRQGQKARVPYTASYSFYSSQTQ